MSLKQTQNGSRKHSLHAHVEGILRTRISSGEYPPGKLLPGRRNLCTELGIAPSTLEKAIKSLLSDGTLRAENRRGTFVANTASSAEPFIKTHRRTETPVYRNSDVAHYRIGIVDTVTELAIMRPDVNWFEYMIVHAAESKVSAQESQMLYLPSGNELHKNLKRAVDEFQNNGADAIIFTAYHDATDAVEEAVGYARSVGIAPVVVASSPREWSCPHVWTDSRLAGRQAAEYLIQEGHQKIAFIAPFDLEWQERRILGVQDAMRNAGLKDDQLIVVRRRPEDFMWASSNKEAAQAGALLFAIALEEAPSINAVIGANDWVSVGIAQAIKENNAQIGADIALVSFDDSLIARQFELSSVRFPLEQLGVEAAALALRAASGERIHHRLRIGGSLILRNSSARSDIPTT